MLDAQLSRRKDRMDNFIIRSIAAGLAMIIVSIAGYSSFPGGAIDPFRFLYCPPIILLAGIVVFAGWFREK